jgi:hypothetical protein
MGLTSSRCDRRPLSLSRRADGASVRSISTFRLEALRPVRDRNHWKAKRKRSGGTSRRGQSAERRRMTVPPERHSRSRFVCYRPLFKWTGKRRPPSQINHPITMRLDGLYTISKRYIACALQPLFSRVYGEASHGRASISRGWQPQAAESMLHKKIGRGTDARSESLENRPAPTCEINF